MPLGGMLQWTCCFVSSYISYSFRNEYVLQSVYHLLLMILITLTNNVFKKHMQWWKY